MGIIIERELERIDISDLFSNKPTDIDEVVSTLEEILSAKMARYYPSYTSFTLKREYESDYNRDCLLLKGKREETDKEYQRRLQRTEKRKGLTEKQKRLTEEWERAELARLKKKYESG